MTDHNKKNDSTQTEWNFEVGSEQLSHPTADKTKTSEKPKKNSKKELELSKKVVDSNKTRDSHYLDLEAEAKLDKDIIEFANVFKRGIALVIDLVFNGFIFLVAKKTILITSFILGLPLKRYNFQWNYNEIVMNKIFTGINTTVLMFSFVLLPILLFNSSFGKKIMKIQIRGTKRYTLSIEQVFIREFLIKPISILSVIGFIIPFFNDKRKSLHDYVAGTWVIKD